MQKKKAGCAFVEAAGWLLPSERLHSFYEETEEGFVWSTLKKYNHVRSFSNNSDDEQINYSKSKRVIDYGLEQNSLSNEVSWQSDNG
jgi:hypothetical protein